MVREKKGGGITVKQRHSPGESEPDLQFAHEWACHLCLPGGTGWGWDKGQDSWVAGRRILWKSGLVAAAEFLMGEKEQTKHQWSPDRRFLDLHTLLPKLGKKQNLKNNNMSWSIHLYVVTQSSFSHSDTTGLKRHVWSANYSFTAKTAGRPRGPLCLMLAPCCLDKAGWLESDYGDKESEWD